MTVTWRSAVRYAFFVVASSWMVGLVVLAAMTLTSRGTSGLADIVGPAELVFPVVAFAGLTVARRVLPPLPRWGVILTDGALYVAILVGCEGVAAWAAGDDSPLDSAFVIAIFALFSLQLPAAWGLSAWRAQHLEVVIRRRPSAGPHTPGD
ncbi:hypothetical protein GL263_16760 [Streptomyces durbertensis]|uniref:Integral membrane protein n=1 Tax=Streptomyces durbertensis TaxID=2448886 RepID=A0ABR6EIS5_9ACTN|nr:hypothetical protein [Streptomyces durbertensis]MBB1245210.1 hypothetical protein [Streptomyces durbertensis]